MREITFRSVKGREINTYIFNNRGPVTLIIGGIHGDEQSGVALAQELIDRLASPMAFKLKSQVVVMPKANPDGFIAGTRVNARGIDINRNFPTRDFRLGRFKESCYPGRRAASEPETIAILQVVSQFKPKLIFSLHSELGCVNYDGPAAEIARAISAVNSLPVCKDLGYPTPGSLGTYYGVERSIPVITLELLPEDNQWERHGKAILQAL